jgi:hypothetical protein
MSFTNEITTLESTGTALVPYESESSLGDIETQPLRTLCDMLTYRRVSGSRTENKFIRRWIMPLGAKPDSFGNHILRIGDSPVMFSSHTDSVHRTAGRQRLLYKHGVLTVKHPPASNKPAKAKTVTRSYQSFASTNNQCLGADDAVGCWIMQQMAQAKVPGLYIWHRQEESGGLGSSYIADNHRELLTGIKAAIAFDRRGTTDVITHQAGGRCASNVFAQSLAGQLPGRFVPDSGGIFTDTANYTGIIGECTNISVGYEHEHTSHESLDLAHALRVRNAMLEFDASRLEYSRVPGTGKYDNGCHWGMSGHDYGGYGGYSSPYGNDHYANRDIWDDVDQTPSSNRGGDFDDMVELIRLNPTEVADLLESYGFDRKGLLEEMRDRGGNVRRFKAY